MKARTKGCLAAGVLFALALGVLVMWPPYYRQDPIRAQIVDRDTEQPIAGAAVAAVWRGKHGGLESTSSVFRVDEAVTDASGRFVLAGWKKRRRLSDGVLQDQDPALFIYSPGYKSLDLNNAPAYVKVIGLLGKSGETVWTPVSTPEPGQVVEKYPGWRWGGMKRYCYWNGKRIGLERAKTVDEEKDALFIEVSVSSAEFRSNTQFPKFWAVWRVGRERLPLNLRKDVIDR